MGGAIALEGPNVTLQPRIPPSTPSGPTHVEGDKQQEGNLGD